MIEQAKAHTLDGTDYSICRKLSTTLAKHPHYLATTFLRRALIEQVLEKGQSKYYHYAASDFKKAKDFAKAVIDWQDMPPHDIFVNTLREKHYRKQVF